MLPTCVPIGAGPDGLPARDFVRGWERPLRKIICNATVSHTGVSAPIMQPLTLFVAHVGLECGSIGPAAFGTLLRLLTGHFDNTSRGGAVRSPTVFVVESGYTFPIAYDDSGVWCLVSSISGDERPMSPTHHMVMETVRDSIGRHYLSLMHELCPGSRRSDSMPFPTIYDMWRSRLEFAARQ